MARLPETFNFGEYEDMTEVELLRQLERMYTNLALAINAKPDLVQRQVDGQVGDTFLSQGTLNINLATNKVEMLTNHDTQTTVIWTTLS